MKLRYALITEHHQVWGRIFKKFKDQISQREQLQFFDEETETWRDIPVVEVDMVAGEEVTKDELQAISWTQ